MNPAASDFASQAMVRVLAQGMRELGLQPPAFTHPPARATVPLDLKRALVQAAVAQGGLDCLPLLGRGVHAWAMEPTHLALTAAQDALALFHRWQRLERYIHSRHRTQVLASGADHALVRHCHREGGPPPLPVEDLVVCGVLCALLQANGLTNVRAQAADVLLYPDPNAEAVAALVHAGQTATWHFSWTTPPVRVAAAVQPPASVLPPDWSALAGAAAQVVAQALPERVRLPQVADALGLPARSLQRALAREGLSFTALVAELRFRLAGWRLVRSELSLAETGFVCGYADQAHLTREFLRRVGVTPARYRSLFAVA